MRGEKRKSEKKIPPNKSSLQIMSPVCKNYAIHNLLAQNYDIIMTLYESKF